MNRITLYHQNVPITHYPLETNTFSIGKAPENDLILACTGVADRHFMVFRDPLGKWRARPLHRDAPTREIPLEPGRPLSLGPFDLAFSVAETKPIHLPQAGRKRQQNLGIVGNSPQTQLLKLDISRLAPLKAPVLITGETGTGKELAARGLHQLSNKAYAPFVAVNCGGFTDSLLEDTLFGHERGAFTGALKRQKGVFEQAAGGTLFLDEIGELPRKQQATLLRVLESKTIKPIGSSEQIPIRFRLITATNCDLSKMISEGSFRRDLFHRISTLSIQLAPLRERPLDIEPLSIHFLSQMASELGSHRLTSTAQQKLLDYLWPGNVRELRNSLYRAAALTDAKLLRTGDFQFDHPIRPPKRKSFRLDDIPQAKLETLLRSYNGNVTATAKALGIPRSSLRDRIHRIQRNN